MNTNKTEQLMNSMTAYSETYYPKKEILPELLDLQKEVVALTFGESNENENLRLNEVMTQMYRTNDEKGHIADLEFAAFKKSCWSIINSIKGEISGNWGEERTLERIESISVPFKFLRNVELHHGDKMTELDFVVVTGKAVYIVEVKNTRKDVFIDEEGGYYTRGRYNRMDCCLKEKMQTREAMLKTILEQAGITNPKIASIVVFTNNRIEVENRCQELRTCFLGQLKYMIEGHRGENLYDQNEIGRIADAVESARSQISYCTNVDAAQFKHDFAVLLSKLEECGEDPLDIAEDPMPVVEIDTVQDSIEEAVQAREKTIAKRRSVRRLNPVQKKVASRRRLSLKRILSSTAPHAAAFMILYGIANMISE